MHNWESIQKTNMTFLLKYLFLSSFNYVYIYMLGWVCAFESRGFGVQKRIHVGLELVVAMSCPTWVLGSKLWSSRRAVYVLNY